MSCTKAELAALLEYLANECEEAADYRRCVQIIRITKKKVEEHAIAEVLGTIFR